MPLGVDTARDSNQSTTRQPHSLKRRAPAVHQCLFLVKLAKVDATKDQTVAQEYGVKGYPTIMFFVNKTKVEFGGQRNADGIIRWCEKKTLPPTTPVETEDELKALKEADQVSLILYSDDQDTITEWESLAVADDDNSMSISLLRVLCCQGSSFGETSSWNSRNSQIIR